MWSVNLFSRSRALYLQSKCYARAIPTVASSAAASIQQQQQQLEEQEYVADRHKYLRQQPQQPNHQSSNVFTSPVIISTSYNVFDNLALEDWIYENATDNLSAAGNNLLFLWRNDPCVVVGRHQNVWVESDVHRATADGVAVARRRSGGGAVFHDRGNVNLSFFTDRKRYDRKRNLGLISVGLNEKWNLPVVVTSRDDLMLADKYKISGTAAKLGGKVAYHHCTLLLDTDLSNVEKYLRGMELGVTTKATASVRANVANLCSVDPRINFSNLCDLMSSVYCAQNNVGTSWSYVDPCDESLFPGIRQMSEQLLAWDWIYGNSPKFTIQRTFKRTINNDDLELSYNLSIEKGHVLDAEITMNSTTISLEKREKLDAYCAASCHALKGARFWPTDFRKVFDTLKHAENDDRSVMLLKPIGQCLSELTQRH